jgi:excinuclease ABC subunit B
MNHKPGTLKSQTSDFSTFLWYSHYMKKAPQNSKKSVEVIPESTGANTTGEVNPILFQKKQPQKVPVLPPAGFILQSEYSPAGDQPEAISQLVQSVQSGNMVQTLLGATGTGKTFTMANVINTVQRPTLVIAHNKTLAAQLAQEFKTFFPDAAVHYFVSYYDYYQPEAYMPITDTYIEKDAQINEEIDRLRHASTQALLSRRDVIIVASVSCIYGLGSPAEYASNNRRIVVGEKISKRELMEHFVRMHYSRTTADLLPATFRAVGNRIDYMPASEKIMYSFVFAGNTIDAIQVLNPVSMTLLEEVAETVIFPAKHFLTEGDKKDKAMIAIDKEMKAVVKQYEKEGKLLEAERIKRRTQNDLAMMREVGYCSGIENYSRHLSGKSAGEPPETLLSYFPPDFITFIDESHVTLPQLSAMYGGDASRKKTLIEFGFRLPSAADNRPLRYEEFQATIGQAVYVSATPGKIEHATSDCLAEQVIRPTGLLDPVVEVRGVVPTDTYRGQIADFIAQTLAEVKKGGRVLATTLTKKMAEDLTDYLKDQGVKAEYMHSDIKTMERIEIISNFRRGVFDCLVGVNLLREGLDMPEVTFIGILDADKEGFLRSETALIQTIGRAARNADGRVVLYADTITGSMERAMGETSRRRDKQIAYNTAHGITPQTISKKIHDIGEHLITDHDRAINADLLIDAELFADNPAELLRIKQEQMEKAVEELDFETAAILRDEIILIKEKTGEVKKVKPKKKRF